MLQQDVPMTLSLSPSSILCPDSFGQYCSVPWQDTLLLWKGMIQANAICLCLHPSGCRHFCMIPMPCSSLLPVLLAVRNGCNITTYLVLNLPFDSDPLNNRNIPMPNPFLLWLLLHSLCLHSWWPDRCGSQVFSRLPELVWRCFQLHHYF